MLSRVAERVYWFARHVERAENTARLMLVHHHLILDLPAKVRPGWGLLIDVMGAEEAFRQVPGRTTEKKVISFVFGNRDNPGSILSSLTYARENMRTTREVMPSEVWERINSLYLSVARRGKQDLPRSARHRVLNDIVQRCQQITGMLAGCMTHGDGYQFIRIGRNLERADMSSRIIDVGSARLLGADEANQPYRNVLWIGVLKSLSAHQMYRQDVRRRVSADDVLQFLFHSRTFPRALAHTLGEITMGIGKLPHHKEALAVVREVSSLLEQTDIAQLRGAELHSFVDRLQIEFGRIHQAIYTSWFAPELAT
jgi:uncharacterized alpha-E superfamily protein